LLLRRSLSLLLLSGSLPVGLSLLLSLLLAHHLLLLLSGGLPFGLALLLGLLLPQSLMEVL
jgi:hypothetical protein